MHLPLWLLLLAAGWLVMAVLATAIVAWVARWGPTEEEALAMTVPPPPTPESASVPQASGVPLASDAG